VMDGGDEFERQKMLTSGVDNGSPVRFLGVQRYSEAW
jgi:hypothetical protein